MKEDKSLAVSVLAVIISLISLTYSVRTEFRESEKDRPFLTIKPLAIGQGPLKLVFELSNAGHRPAEEIQLRYGILVSERRNDIIDTDMISTLVSPEAKYPWPISPAFGKEYLMPGLILVIADYVDPFSGKSKNQRFYFKLELLEGRFRFGLVKKQEKNELDRFFAATKWPEK